MAAAFLPVLFSAVWCLYRCTAAVVPHLATWPLSSVDLMPLVAPFVGVGVCGEMGGPVSFLVYVYTG